MVTHVYTHELETNVGGLEDYKKEDYGGSTIGHIQILHSLLSLKKGQIARNVATQAGYTTLHYINNIYLT